MEAAAAMHTTCAPPHAQNAKKTRRSQRRRALRRPHARRVVAAARAVEVEQAEKPAAAEASVDGAASAPGSAMSTFEEPPPVAPGVVIGDDNVGGEKSKAGSSGISSGLRLEGVSARQADREGEGGKGGRENMVATVPTQRRPNIANSPSNNQPPLCRSR